MPAHTRVLARTERELVSSVAGADARGEPVLVVGGGTRVVVDDGFDGTIVQVATTGLLVDAESCYVDTLASCSAVMLTVAAGEIWDDLVARCVANEWIGVEALSGMPGQVGAVPIHNLAAHGQQVSDTIARVRTWDRHERAQRTFAMADCRFTPGASRFGEEPDRYLILEVAFQVLRGDLGERLRSPELARRLGVELNSRAPLVAVRRAVLDLRREAELPSNVDVSTQDALGRKPHVYSAGEAGRAYGPKPQAYSAGEAGRAYGPKPQLIGPGRPAGPRPVTPRFPACSRPATAV